MAGRGQNLFAMIEILFEKGNQFLVILENMSNDGSGERKLPTRSQKAAVNMPIPAPGSSNTYSLGIVPKRLAMNRAISGGVKTCPRSFRCSRETLFSNRF
jgi:hypothetical protein